MFSGPSHSTTSKLYSPYAPSEKKSKSSPESAPYLELPTISSNSFEELSNHRDFETIKAQFLSDIDDLENLVIPYVGTVYTDAIRDFRAYINNQSTEFRDSLIPLYRETRGHIHEILMTIKASCQAPDSLAESTPEWNKITQALHQCLNGIENCPAGIHSRFSMAYSAIKADTEELDAQIFLIRRALYEKFVSSFLTQISRENLIEIHEDMEIHWFNSLHNLTCLQYGLATIDDRLAPLAIPDTVIECFLSELPLVMCEQRILQTLASEKCELFQRSLNSQNLSDWLEQKIQPEEISEERIDLLEKSFFIPMNQLCEVKDENKKINLWTLLDEKDGQYSFARYRERVLGWLTQSVMKATPSVFVEIPESISVTPEDDSFFTLPAKRRKLSTSSTPSAYTKQFHIGAGAAAGRRYISSFNNLFFWTHEQDDSACLQSKRNFDDPESLPLTISDLTNLYVFTWPEPVQQALLSQALLQTEDASAVTDFFLHGNNDIALTKYSVCTQKVIASAMTETMASKQCFAKRLIEGFCISMTRDIPEWVLNTPLLEPLLLSYSQKGKDISGIKNKLTVWHIMQFSTSSMEAIFTPEECRKMFHIALENELGMLMGRLLQTGHCNTLVNNSNAAGYSVLMILCQQKKTSDIDYLLKEQVLLINDTGPTGWAAIHNLARHGHANGLSILLRCTGIHLDNTNIFQQTALHIAAMYGHKDCVEILLNNKISWHKINRNGQTALHIAAQYGHSNCVQALLNNPDIKENINIRDDNLWTALHHAAHEGHLGCVKQLLNNGIDLNALNSEHQTAAQLAFSSGHSECLDKLVTQHELEKDSYPACDSDDSGS